MTPQAAATNCVIALTSDLMSYPGRGQRPERNFAREPALSTDDWVACQSMPNKKKEKEETMAEQKGDRTEILAMWIMVAVVVLLILAGTGWHMWTHPDWMHGG